MKYGVSSSLNILQIQKIVMNSVAGGLTGTNRRNEMKQVPLYSATDSLFEQMSHHAAINTFNIYLSSSNLLVGTFDFKSLTSYHQTKHTLSHKLQNQLKDICMDRGLLPPTLDAPVLQKIKEIKTKINGKEEIFLTNKSESRQYYWE